MTDPNKLLVQIQELDDHIQRLITNAKELQESLRKEKNESQGRL